MLYPPVSNENGTFQMTRAEKSSGFDCDRCLQPKQSKVTVAWFEIETEREKVICNACYGMLRSLG